MADDGRPRDKKPTGGDFEKLKICMANAIIDHSPKENRVYARIDDHSRLGVGRGGEYVMIDSGSHVPDKHHEIVGIIERKGQTIKYAIQDAVNERFEDPIVLIEGNFKGGKLSIEASSVKGATAAREPIRKEAVAIRNEAEACLASSGPPVLKKPVPGTAFKP